jgi:hypothetical protein
MGDRIWGSGILFVLYGKKEKMTDVIAINPHFL